MDIRLPSEEELLGLGKPWPLKDAQPVWQAIYDLSVRDFISLVPLLEFPRSLLKVGRPNRIEKLARQILFEMSAGQRKVAYNIILKKAPGVEKYLEVKRLKELGVSDEVITGS
jgi:hypothetical protein